MRAALFTLLLAIAANSIASAQWIEYPSKGIPRTPDGKPNMSAPAPKQADFSLFMRAYWPKVAVTDGSWTPPPVQRVGG